MSKHTVYDLTAASIFKVTFFSALFIYLPLLPVLLLFAFLLNMMVQLEDLVSIDSVTFVAAAGAVAIPFVWGLCFTLGRWFWSKIQAAAPDVDIEFSSGGRKFGDLTPQTIYRVMAFCAKGVLAMVVILYLLLLLLTLLAGNLGSGLLSAGVGVILILFLTIMPYVWAYFLMLASYFSRPIARKFGWGMIEFRPEA